MVPAFEDANVVGQHLRRYSNSDGEVRANGGLV